MSDSSYIYLISLLYALLSSISINLITLEIDWHLAYDVPCGLTVYDSSVE